MVFYLLNTINCTTIFVSCIDFHYVKAAAQRMLLCEENSLSEAAATYFCNIATVPSNVDKMKNTDIIAKSLIAHIFAEHGNCLFLCYHFILS